MKRGAPLQRRTPLERGGPIRRRRARRIDRETPEERRHKELVRRMTDCSFARSPFPHLGPCDGPLQLAHLGIGKGGMGLKKGDWTHAAMACASHHDQWDGREQPSVFAGWPRERKLTVANYLIDRARAFVAAQGAPF